MHWHQDLLHYSYVVIIRQGLHCFPEYPPPHFYQGITKRMPVYPTQLKNNGDDTIPCHHGWPVFRGVLLNFKCYCLFFFSVVHILPDPDGEICKVNYHCYNKVWNSSDIQYALHFALFFYTLYITNFKFRLYKILHIAATNTYMSLCLPVCLSVSLASSRRSRVPVRLSIYISLFQLVAKSRCNIRQQMLKYICNTSSTS